MEARALGFILALRGHVCVNGAGSFGCMAAMNAGAASGNGHIVGVIHEMWVVDGSDWSANVVDAGAHDVFTNPADRDGPIRELLVAGGDDLQERKKLLVKDADALIVLPGGPGTWDEVRTKPCRRILKCDFCSLESQTRVFVFSCGKWLVLDRLVFRTFQ
jgi:predicted Rossmann-fold nucleotide-binding protein